jgi:hypothetical protein
MRPLDQKIQRASRVLRNRTYVTKFHCDDQVAAPNGTLPSLPKSRSDWRVAANRATLPFVGGMFELIWRVVIGLFRSRASVRIPTKPAMHSNLKLATYSDLKPAGVPI